jgi:DNA-binding IclR family transcriptional regulator
VTSVGVLDKVMAILDAFADGTARLEPAEVAARTGISAPTAYRLMGAMAEHRLLGSDGRGYRLGTRLLQLGARVSEGVEVRALALPHMKELRDATGETVELQILTGHSRVPVEMVVGRRTVRTMGQIGVPLPIHLGASSRVLVAWLEEQTALELAGRSAAEHPGTPWDPQAYRERLRLVRGQGWEFSAGERDPETSAVSAPILDRHDDVIAAVVVSGTATRLAGQAHRSAVIAQTCAAAAAISTELGRGAGSPNSQESIA